MRSVLLTILAISIAGCGAVKEWEPHKERTTYYSQVRQLPPEPVYDRLRYANLPQPLPDPDTAKMQSEGTITPTFSLAITNSNLDRTATALADLVHYRSYVSAQVSDQPFSISAYGTIDEIADQIARDANINVSVDHATREIRFLTKVAVEPRLTGESNEYKQAD